MIKYIYTLATLLDSKSRSKKHFSADTKISDLFDESLDEIDFIKSLCELELIYGFEIPEDLYDRTDYLTLGQIAQVIAQLPIISDDLYPEFYDIKMESMRLTKRYIEIETKTDEESLREKKMINEKFEELSERLNNLL